MIDPAGILGRTLNAAAALMADASDPWWIIGSAAVELHGYAQAGIGDVDVLASRRDVAAVSLGLGMPVIAGVPHPLFRSRAFARLAHGPLPIEFMADFAVATPAGWQHVAFRSRERVRVGDADLFVPAIDELTALLLLFGRDKDVARAASMR